MAKKQLPSPEDLRKMLRYEPDTGKLFWRSVPVDLFKSGVHSAERRCRAWNGKYAGKPALIYREPNRPYAYGDIFGVKCYAHRAILAMHTGSWPDFVDHINGDMSDNRLHNLRACTPGENMMNRAIGSANTSSAIGVSFDKARNLWAAEIRRNSARFRLGRFLTLESAKEARRKAEMELGFHPNHGRIKTSE